MKYLILISLFCTLIFADKINEHKIDLYFGNGIQNTFQEANAAGNDLANKLLKKVYFQWIQSLSLIK